MPDLQKLIRDRVNRPIPDLARREDDDAIALPAASTTASNAAGNGKSLFVNQADAPLCPNCGSHTVRNGACYKCNNCGESLGCS